MRALLLAAGLGTRLQPLTESVPKAMVPVGGVPMLERNIRLLKESGITEMAVNLHHLPEVVRGHFGDGSGFGVSIRWSHEPQLLGTAGALLPLRDFFEDRFLVLYADNLIAIDLEAVERTHRGQKAALTMALWQRDDVSSSGVAELDEHGLLRRFIEKPASRVTVGNWVNAGFLICEPDVHGFIREPPSDFGHSVIPAMLAGGERIAGYRMGAGEVLRWIDTPDDLARVEAELERDPIRA